MQVGHGEHQGALLALSSGGALASVIMQCSAGWQGSYCCTSLLWALCNSVTWLSPFIARHLLYSGHLHLAACIIHRVQGLLHSVSCTFAEAGAPAE